MSIRNTFAAALFAFAGFAQAQSTPLAGDGTWQSFDVSSLLSLSSGVEWIDLGSGAPLSFSFVVDPGNYGLLTVVDAGYAGDTFQVFNGSSLLGSTSAVPVGVYPGVPGITDPELALADPSFSRASFVLGAGAYSIGGQLDQSVLEAPGGARLDSTVGSIRLAVSPVPEASSVTLMLVGLGVMGFIARRRRAL